MISKQWFVKIEPLAKPAMGKMESHLLTMGPEAAVYAGLKFKEAREKIVEDLKLRDELLKVEDHAHKVGECERCQTVAEPMISKQWFVKIEPLAKPAIHAVETGQIEFSPKSWEKTYFEWMYNIRDWCISRQLWWGHQIPAWYCDACDAITVSRQAPQQCSGCHQDATHLKQDEDVLDTWFSSALWPFSTLGWPDQTRALKTFYPTSILETGFDIIFFWVARMIMMGIHFMGEVPFKKVYLHAMVRDEKGEKMSKSKGNVIDPLELIDQHGADALRFTLAAMAGQGRDIKLSTDRVEGYRAFGNKLWNAVKFFHLQIQEPQEPFLAPPEGLETWVMNHFDSLPVTHQATIVRFHEAIQKVEHGLVHFELNESAQALYEFIWLEFCDWFIEFSKLSLKSLEKTSEHAPSGERQATLYVLHYLLDQSLKALHPFMPFLTEELWQSLPVRTSAKNVVRESLGYAEMDTLMLQSYPKTNVKLIHELPGAKKALEEVGAIKTIVEAIRNFRGENNISPKIEFDVWVQGNKKIPHQEIIMTLSKIKSLQALSPGQVLGEMESVIVLQSLGLELKINLDGLVNKEEEIKRLKKEMDKAIADREHSEAKLSRESFIQKAPAALVAQEKKTVEELKSKEAELKKALERLGVVS
jgi:valyl-tRNA synthetase